MTAVYYDQRVWLEYGCTGRRNNSVLLSGV